MLSGYGSSVWHKKFGERTLFLVKFESNKSESSELLHVLGTQNPLSKIDSFLGSKNLLKVKHENKSSDQMCIYLFKHTFPSILVNQHLVDLLIMI